MEEEEEKKRQEGFSHFLDRRKFLKGMGMAGGMIAAWDLANKGIVSPASAAEPKRGGTLTFAMPATPAGFDPAFFAFYEMYHITELCYNRLLLMMPDLKLAPELAVRWSSNKAGNEWTFYLRKGVKFHNGRELEAKDVVTSMNYYLEAKGPAASEMSPAERFEGVDKYTVKAFLKTGDAEFPYNLTKPQTAIVPHDMPREKLKTTIMGTGPFKFAKFVPGEFFMAERNPNYWDKDHIFLDAVKAVIIPDFATTMNALISGEIDLMWDCEPEQFFFLQKKKGITAQKIPGTTHQDIVMDTTSKPFDDIRVRQAIKACVNREVFVQAVLQGLGVPANDHPTPNFHPYYLGVPIKKQDYNLAKKLLTEAGYPKGVNLVLDCSEVRAGMVPSAITLKDQCAPAGINIDVKVNPSDGYWNQIYRKVPFFLDNWGGRPTAYSNLFPWFHSRGNYNNSKYGNALIDSCLDNAVGETDSNKAAKFFAAVQALISDEGGLIIPYLRDYTMAYSEKVHGYHLYFNKWMRWTDVWKG